MAQSRSGKSSGRSSQKSSSARKGSSSKRRTSAQSRSTSQKKKTSKTASSRARRRQERHSVMGSIPLAAIGILAIALVIVPGQSVWSVVRSWMFGVFGIVTYLVGPLLLYLAYLMASGYLVGKFLAKTTLLALVCASVPVVFSDFKVGDSNFLQVVQTLFAWGQTKFWSGGVFGGAIGATLVALCGRPAANFVMLLLFVTGLMVFFAVTPRDVVQFILYQSARLKEAREATYEEEDAYDTQLFSGSPEEEPIENLTGTLPQSQSVPHHPAFDAAPYLAQDEARKNGRRTDAQPMQNEPAAAAAPAAPVMPEMDTRASFDVDLGPDMSTRALHEAVEHDPLEPVVIGPGGTFGLDPLEHLGKRKRLHRARHRYNNRKNRRRIFLSIWRPHRNRMRLRPGNWMI